MEIILPTRTIPDHAERLECRRNERGKVLDTTHRDGLLEPDTLMAHSVCGRAIFCAAREFTV